MNNMRREEQIAQLIVALIIAGVLMILFFGCAPVLKTWEAGHPLAGQHISETGNCHTEYTSEGCEIEWCNLSGVN